MKTHTITFLLLLIIFSKTEIGFSQDPHFSQFFHSPLTLNPALTGKFDGQYRIAGIHRNQWPAISNAFITTGISVDGSIAAGKLRENNRLGIGLSALTDKTGNSLLKSNYLALSCAYEIALDQEGYNQLAIGFQGSYGNRRLNIEALKFGSQLDPAGSWTRPSNENLSGTAVNLHYFEVNAGILFNGSTNGVNNYYIGASVFHINSPQEGFLNNGSFKLARRYTIHSGGAFSIGATSLLYITALYNQQNSTKEIVLGTALKFPLVANENSPVNFFTGCWARVNNQYDAVIPYVGLDYSEFKMGLTYDVNISTLATGSQQRGGMEITLVYTHQQAVVKKGIPCPRF